MKGIILILSLASMPCCAQILAPFDSSHWRIEAKQAVFEEYMGKKCLKISDGYALLKDAILLNGIVEFDIAMTRSYYFPGIAFRAKDIDNAEFFYLRPHLSGNPDAIQYYPEYNGSSGWQLYYGDGYINAHELPVDRWLHIKMVIKDSAAEIYLDNDRDPVLSINKLLRPAGPGEMILSNSMPATARFADFSYTATDHVVLKNKPKAFPPLPASVITSWQVSQRFDETLIKNKNSLSDSIIRSLSWHSLPADDRGIADLAILGGAESGKNTVIAKLIITSDKEQVKKLTFGFSDRANLYLNNTLLYTGEDNFRSRDYRFLGTMGYFDAVPLHLKKGNNEVLIAVSEDLGGWGVMAKLEPFD